MRVARVRFLLPSRLAQDMSMSLYARARSSWRAGRLRTGSSGGAANNTYRVRQPVASAGSSQGHRLVGAGRLNSRMARFVTRNCDNNPYMLIATLKKVVWQCGEAG